MSYNHLRKAGFISVGMLLICFGFCQAAVGAGRTNHDPNTLLLKARKFVPAIASQLPISRKARHAIIQFEGPPQNKTLNELIDQGVKILQYVPRNAVMTFIPADADLGPIPGIRWVGKLQPDDKFDRHLKVSLEKGFFLVDVFPDVTREEAERVILSAGGELLENAYLLDGTYLVHAGAEVPAKVARADEVSWIWAASDAIIAGLPVQSCPGGMTSSGPVANYVAHDDGWDGLGQGSADLYYHFMNGTPDIAGVQEELEVERALNEWTNYVAISWTEATSSGLNRSMDILWGSGEHGDGYAFDGPSGVLAHCFFPSPPNPETIAGDMHFDEDDTWRIGSDIELFSVALHESGHGLGLGHSSNPDAVMYAYYSGLVTGLHQDDVDGIRSIYAAAGVGATPNDDFADAITISGPSGQTTGSNVGASKEPGEPNHAANQGGKSVWWSWTAPDSGTVVFDTFGSNFDTLLAVYIGGSVSSLSEIASDDDSGWGYQSSVTFTATAGMTYMIAVDGYSAVSGSIVLNWDYPILVENDNFADALTITGFSGQTTGSNVGASSELLEPDHAYETGGKSVWWSWTAPDSGTVTIDTFGSDFDTLLGVYTGLFVWFLSEVAGNDDSGSGFQSSVTFTATAGTTYKIAVDGYHGASGNIVLNWDLTNVPILDHFEFSQIASSQYLGLPFEATILATDVNGETVTSFEETVNLDGLGSEEDLTIGDGTSSWWYPLYSYFEDARTQVIYLANEIGRAGRISSLSLDVTTVPGQILNNWTIRMKHTELENYTSVEYEGTGWTTVYAGREIITSTGWTKFEFTTPFDYDGTNNLLVDFSFNNTSWSSQGESRFSQPGGTRTLYLYSDSDDGDPLTWSGASPIPFTTTIVPNIKMQVGDGAEVVVTGPVTFIKGLWSGNVTVMEPIMDMYLYASDDPRYAGRSNKFDVVEMTAAITDILFDVASVPNIKISGDNAVVVDLYASDDLVTWTLIAPNISLSGGSHTYADSAGKNKEKRFYRLLIKTGSY